MFGRRADAKLVRDLSTTRAIMPFVSPRRNDSLVYYKQEIEADPALRFIAQYNETAPEGRRLTLFQLLLRAISKTIKARPSVNRFVAGGRLWQRDEVWITFSAKMELKDRAPVVTVKRRFDQDEGLVQMVDSLMTRLERRRGGEKDSSDREMSLALRFPPFVIRIGIWLLNQANQLGILPKKMIDDDPLFTSIFIANLGSVDMETAFHHLWEYGTSSMFAMMGRVKQREDGSRYFEVSYTYDERMEDGMYGGIGMAMIKDDMEHPEKLL